MAAAPNLNIMMMPLVVFPIRRISQVGHKSGVATKWKHYGRVSVPTSVPTTCRLAMTLRLSVAVEAEPAI